MKSRNIMTSTCGFSSVLQVVSPKSVKQSKKVTHILNFPQENNSSA